MDHGIKDRYARQEALPEIGKAGQLLLAQASVLVVGAGGLGCPAMLYLAGAGVGQIGVVDHDQVAASNLPRQVLYREADLGRNKAEAAVQQLRLINSTLQYEAIPESLHAGNAKSLIREYEIVLDCTDDFATRFVINDFCRELQKPVVHGALHRYQGQVSVFHYPDDRGVRFDYRELVPSVPNPATVASCVQDGILGTVAGVIGTIQAEQAIKVLCGMGDVLAGKVLLLDLRHYTTKLLELSGYSTREFSPAPDLQQVLPHSFEVSIEEMSAGSFTLLDVRESAEQIKDADAVNLPYSDLDEGYRQLDPATTWLVVCESGLRSRAVTGWLRSKGFERVFSLRGGLAELQSRHSVKSIPS
jgi:adenylyltransferase/sulfurtransferase